MNSTPNRMLHGENVLRIVWLPGTDRLRGICHCGATEDAGDPATVWEWLLAHPAGHRPERTAPEQDPTDPAATQQAFGPALVSTGGGNR